MTRTSPRACTVAAHGVNGGNRLVEPLGTLNDEDL